MGKLTSEVFNESCCDGGSCSTHESAQPCGCDLGADYYCDDHKWREPLDDLRYEMLSKMHDEDARVTDIRYIVDRLDIILGYD